MNADNSTFGKFNAGNTFIAIDDVADIAKRAGEAIMKIYNAPDFEAKMLDDKSDGSPLTMADLEANKIICSALKDMYPEIPIISEEIKNESFETRKDWEYFWCVDPLDGTKEFKKRNGQFTVNIGLCKGSEPIAGVVYCPALDPPLMYKGAKGLGPPVREECDAVGGAAGYDSFKVIKVAHFDERDAGLNIVASASHNTPETDGFIAKYKDPKRVSKGSSLKLLMVAEGTAHIYPRFAPTMEWDTCAAHAIVECAGGVVLQAEGDVPASPGEPVRYNKENLRNPYFVVKGKVIDKSKKKAKKDVKLGGEDEKSGLNPAFIILALVVALLAYLAVAAKK